MYSNRTSLFLAISICLFFFLTLNDIKSEEIRIISGIAKVTDGDTIRIDQKKIRFYGIDAPENKQKCNKPWLTISFFSLNKEYMCGEFSTNRLKDKINDKFVICKWKEKDRYKRFIAECFKEKTNINAWMVRNGYAVAYVKYSKKFISHESMAKKQKLGLWAGTFEMPWDYRKKN